MAHDYSGALSSVSPLQTALQSSQLFQLSQQREKEQQQLAKQEQLQDKMVELLRSGTTQQIAEFSVKNKELGEILNKQIGYRSDMTKDIMAGTLASALIDPTNRTQIIEQGAEQIRKAGGDPQTLLKSLEQTDDNFEKGALMMLGGLGDKGEGYLKQYAAQQPKAAKFSGLRTDEEGRTTALNETEGQIVEVPTAEGVTRSADKPQVQVNLAEKGRVVEQEALAKNRVSHLEKLQEAAYAAEDELESIKQLRAIDIETGFGTEMKAKFARAINFLGGDGEKITGVNVSDTEKLNAVAKRQMLNIMATQKGPQTDTDAERIEETVNSLDKTSEANEFIRDSAEALAYRKIEHANFFEDYLEDNGTLKGAERAWNEFKKNTPMLSEVVRDPDTNRPMFFYQFREVYRSQGYKDGEIVDAWRTLTGGE
ncbi:hypothetical protein [Vibrio sp. SCSIO 43136]|uniref:hypothetical protein n=1 Tax=Vibrio sp. SCSIO 43136 TaxID=2819101 RepID=UPI002075C0DA|nr:hypothetical protein [Vibrio sp. SCSIO 43136]USD64207.1 hypothetical protein J4N39_08795 [Vibrio sp. SCSIO 43136]